MKRKNDSRGFMAAQSHDGFFDVAPAEGVPTEALSKRGARAAGLTPSRSELRREALNVLAMAERLLELPPATRERLALGESVRREVLVALSIRAHGARKRQLQFLAKQLRRDEASLAAVRDAVEANSDVRRRDAALLHRIERWRDRLLDEGDPAISDLFAEFPDAGFDRQQLRALLRQAAAEDAAGQPPAAARQLFRLLREAIG
jgi:ribosome-associated protein